MILLTLMAILLLLYFSLLHLTVRAWSSVQAEKVNKVKIHSLTVIIAARNEVTGILSCLESILKNTDSALLHEIIVVDDHSEDDLATWMNKWNLPKVRYMALPDGRYGKKAAITMGIAASTSEVIAVTDADSQPGEKWLATIASYFSSNEDLDMITGLVLPTPAPHVLGRFQWLDFAATMSLTHLGIHKGWFYLANGANMAFRRSAFQYVHGYQGNEQVASGDDVFLISKIAALSGRAVTFMKEQKALVTTKSESSWHDLWQQRKRWAQKTKAYASKEIIWIQGLAFILSLLWWVSIPIAIFGKQSFIYLPVLTGIGKMAVDYWFLQRLSSYFGQSSMLKLFPVSWLIYQAYIVFMGLIALIPGNIRWKNRVLR